MHTYLQNIRAFIRDENGATAIEYALLAGLIALAIAVGAGALGTALNTKFNTLATQVTNAGS
jgi:pilus assembly protein Flp/PilA